jgi:hypothetical protein
VKSRWPAFLLTLGASIALALAILSTAPRFLWITIPIALACVFLVFRGARTVTCRVETRVDTVLLAAVALLITIILATVAMSKSWEQNPQGQWDAWSIWNLRARFLASPEPSRAWSPLLTNTHPEYPLLVSGAVATTGSPNAVGYLFFLSLIATVTGGLAIARGPLAGLVAGLTLASTGALLHEVPSQYADVPLAAYLAGAVIFILIDQPILAGVLAGFAAWTKDEGALFCIALLALLAIFRRRDLLRTLLGMLPGGLVCLGFKTFLVPHVTSQFGPGTLARFADFSRWSIVIKGVASSISTLGSGWYHPIFVIAVLAWAVRFRTDSRRDAQFSTVLAVTILVGYCAVMVTATADATWQTNTAASRLVVQWWPLAVIAMTTWLRPAEEQIVEEAPAKKNRR